MLLFFLFYYLMVTVLQELFKNDLLLTCPITKKPFPDPVKAEDGFTYEKDAIIDHASAIH